MIGTAHAETITGVIYNGAFAGCSTSAPDTSPTSCDYYAANATTSSVSGLLGVSPGAEIGTFTITTPNAPASDAGDITLCAGNETGSSGINCPGSAYTISQFFSTETGTGISYTLAGAGSTTTAALDSHTADDILIEITCSVTVTSGETFTVNHDDGISLTIGSQSLFPASAAGPTSAETSISGSIASGNAGTDPFTLVYGECCGAPAELDIALPEAVTTVIPEPSSVALFGTGLLAMGVGLIRRKRS
jgi:hypothetical protein